MCTTTTTTRIFLITDLTGNLLEDTLTIFLIHIFTGIPGFDLECHLLAGLTDLDFMKATPITSIMVTYIDTVIKIDVTMNLLMD